MSRKLVRSALCCAAMMSWAASVLAGATNTLRDVSFASLPGGRFEVQMKFDSAPVEPAGYEIDKPARIVFDFADVKNALASKKFPLPFENAQSAVVLGGEDRTRLILNMTSLDAYKTRVEGNSFYIEVGSDKVQEVLTKSSTLADKSSSEETVYDSAITAVDFRRGESGEGRVLIDLSKPAVNVNVEQTSKEIKLTFLDTKLPVDLRRKLDVVDFATPVLSISSSFDGQNTLVSIKPKGEYDYLAYQADNQYVVSVKELSASEVAEKKAKFAYVGEKLSLNFQDIPVRSVLQIIADFTELNLVASDTVKGTITLRLDNVPWDQALDLVLKTKNLDKRQVGNVLMVAPAEEIADQERKQLETQKQLRELAPLRTEYVQVLYADAEELFKLFKKGGKDDKTQSILSERGSAIVDTRTNSIVLTETEQKIADFRELIKRLDVPVRQVSIEARLVKATDNFTKALGVRWGFLHRNDANSTNAIGTGGFLVPVDVANGDDVLFTPGVDPTSATAVGMGVEGATSAFTLGLLDDENNLLSLELTAQQVMGHAEVVSQPKVVTQDKKEAVIKSGEKIPYSTTSDEGTETEFEDAVLGLTVTPYITPNDRILMDVNVTKDSAGEPVAGAIPINTTEITTQIMVDNGQTAVIGGIFEEDSGSSVDKVPFLGDLPFVGALFRRTVDRSTKTELLIFLTPRILSDPLASD